MRRQSQRLRGDSVQEIWDKVRNEYPSGTKIVSVERIIVDGPLRLFSKASYEAQLSVPVSRPEKSPKAEPQPALDLSARAGIAALLEDADDDDLQPQSGAEAAVKVSTELGEFDSMLSELVAETRPQDAGPCMPGPGDLLLLVGLGDDAVVVAADLARQGLLLATAGLAGIEGVTHIENSASALAARAAGVRAKTGTAVASGVDITTVDLPQVLDTTGPEYVWIVVDASRKHEDTAAWVEAVRAHTPVQGMVVVGQHLTASPDTPMMLGIEQITL